MNYDNNENKEFEQEEMLEEELPETEEDAEGTDENVPSERKPKGGKKKKRRKKHYFLKFCILVALCIAAYFFLHSDVFTVKKIVLQENDHMTSEEFKELSGYKKGMNLFEIDKRATLKKLEEDTYIKEATIERELPDTVNVTLVLRDKTAVLEYDDEYVLIDNEGIVIDITEDAPKYTVLEGITVKEAEKGEKVKVKQQEKYDTYMDFLQKTKKADMYFKKLELDGKKIKAYATDKLYCTGTIENVTAAMEDGSLQSIFYRFMKKNIEKGVLTIGDDQYYSYSK